MITTMTEIYPDEILYSWFARYHKINGNLKLSDTVYDLCNYNSKSFSLNQTFGLNNLCNNILEILNYTPEYLIRNHTIFPYFKPFMNRQKSKKIIEKMKGNKSISRSSIIKINSINNSNEFKICPKCYIEDKEKYGEAYIHRIHQLCGMNICNKHSMRLININYNKCLFIDLDDIEKEIKEETLITDKKLITLGQDIMSIINSEYWYEQDLDNIKELYKKKLTERCYRNKDGFIKRSKLIGDFKKFYSDEIFNLLNINTDCNFISKLITQKDRTIAPLYHILFIRFLFGDLYEFEHYQYKEPEYFGFGPWPCLNTCCPQFKENTIKTCDIKRNLKNGYYIGIFKCNTCGYIYSRRYNALNSDKFRVSRVISYGDLWVNKLRNIVSQKQYSLREMGRIMGCSRETIKTQAKNLEIYIGDYSERKYIDNEKRKNKEKNNINNDIVNEYKMRIIDLINNNQSLIRTEIKKILPKEYEYLYRHERKWFENKLPKPVLAKQSMERYSQNYRKTKDIEICEKVEDAIIQIIQNTSLKRVTKRAIADIVSYHGILKPSILAKMPLTKKLLDEKCETIEQFKLRKNKIAEINKL